MEEKTIAPNTEMPINPAFMCGGFGSSLPFGGMFGYLLGAILTPSNSIISVYPTLPEVPEGTWRKFEEETKDMSFEEKKPFMKKYFDPEGIMDKYFDKLKNPKEAAKLNSKLIKQDAKIAVINQKKQEIVDKWVHS